MRGLIAVGFVVALVLFPAVVVGGDGVSGVASWYGSGGYGPGAAMPFCTWTLRYTQGCGSVRILAENGREATVPVIDYCQCYVGTPQERVIDLQPGTLELLGLDPNQGLYRVTVWTDAASAPPITIPNTAAKPSNTGFVWWFGAVILWAVCKGRRRLAYDAD